MYFLLRGIESAPNSGNVSLCEELRFLHFEVYRDSREVVWRGGRRRLSGVYKAIIPVAYRGRAPRWILGGF